VGLRNSRVNLANRTDSMFCPTPTENVSTMEVRDVMLECRVLQDCNAYGVTVPSQPDGRAGMVAVIVRPEFKSKMDEAMLELGKHAQKELPPYAVARFVRVFETFESTSTGEFSADGSVWTGIATDLPFFTFFSNAK